MTLFGYVLEFQELLILAFIGLLVGMSKGGVHGAGMIAVPLLATIFGGKNSSGIMLPLLIMADIFGVSYYHRHAQWAHLRKLLPYALIGIVLGTWTGDYIDDNSFKLVMAIIIFVSLGIMLYLEGKKSEDIPSHRAFAISTGVAGGFTTMVGNLAGSVMALYLLTVRLPKNQFIGTAAWFFLMVNVIKVPFHVFVWKTISINSFLLDLCLLPVIALGALVGIMLVKRIQDKWYRYFIMIMTLIAAIFMII
jgi:uncharacterized membrane protein YfcA